MATHNIKTHLAVCTECGKEFKQKNNSTLAVCPECRVNHHPCPICGKPVPYGRKFCSYSCNSKHNIANFNPMSSQENRDKLSASLNAHFGEQWAVNKQKREEEHREWKKGEFERRSIAQKQAVQRMKARGVLMGLADPEVKKKAMETAEKNGGMGLSNPKARERARKTCLECYGVENPVKTPEVRKKISEKAKVFRNNPDIKEKAIHTLQERYGVSNAFLVGAESRPAKYTSAAEDEIAEYISSLGVRVQRHNYSLLNRKSEIDIYCPDYNVAIEFNGMYWHSTEVQKDKYYHSNKTRQCAEKGVRLIHIYEWEWSNPVKQQILKSFLKVVFQKIENPIYARQCEIREVSTKDYRAFCELNHLQGYRAAKVVYGLYYQDTLVQLMSFSPPQKRNAKETFQWEIVRGCPGSNNVVVGGVSKLWKHFLKVHQPESVMSYCDTNKFDGHSYLDIGMTLYKDDPLNVWYVDIHTGKVQQWLFRDKEKREALLANSFIVYGAGNKTFVWRRECV